MNVVKHFIKEIHSEKENEYQPKNAKEKWIEVDVTFDVYGSIRREKRHFPNSIWEKNKQRWYFIS